MATFCPTSGTIRFSDIKSAFGLTSVSLKTLRSTIYWKATAYKGTFPSFTINLSNFYGTGGTSPVTTGSTYYGANNGTTQGATSTNSYTVPLYYQMTIHCRAAGGGGGGGGGATYNFNGTLQSTGNGYNGSAGENTSFGTLNTAYGGAGGTPGVNGANGAGSDNIAVGGAGGSSGYVGVAAGGKGGDGGFNAVTVLSPVNGGTGPAPGTVITATAGKGGSGGAGYGTGGGGSPGRYGEMAVYIS